MTAPVAIVTGAAGGIGTAVSLALAAAGHEVVGVGRSPDSLAVLAATALDHGLTIAVRSCDVTAETDCADLAAAYPGATVLAHCAGAAVSASVTKETLDNWDRMFAVNATSAFLLARAFLPVMTGRDYGRIVMVASTLAHVGEPYTAAYAAAKHAVLGLSRVIAAEVGGSGVTCNCVCPTYVRTPMTERSVAAMADRVGRPAAELTSTLVRRSPLGRLVEPEEVAAAVLAFADRNAGAINGQSLVLDGGALQR